MLFWGRKHSICFFLKKTYFYIKISKKMLTKERVINDIKNMPNEFSIDELVERLLFISAVEKGMEQDDKNEVMTTEELKQKLGK